MAGPKGEPDAGVAADAVGVDLEEAAAVEAHRLDCLSLAVGLDSVVGVVGVSEG